MAATGTGTATISEKTGDIEAGGRKNNEQLYPGMMEDPKIRWIFIRKVYTIVCIQLAFTFGVSIFMALYHPVKPFLLTSTGTIIFFLDILLTFLSMVLMISFAKEHPWNYIMMVYFNMFMSFLIGVICTYKHGPAVLEAARLSALVTVGLTLYTFWAAKKGYDFSFLWPFLLCALLVLLGFSIMRIFFPFGTWGQMIFGCVGALIFSAFIIYDTESIIKRFSYDDYIIAAATLYLDIINLFLSMLTGATTTD